MQSADACDVALRETFTKTKDPCFPPRDINPCFQHGLIELNIPPGRCLWWCYTELLCGTCTHPEGRLTCKHNNTEMWSASLLAWSPLCVGGKLSPQSFLWLTHKHWRFTKLRTAWPLHVYPHEQTLSRHTSDVVNADIISQLFISFLGRKKH